MDALRDRYNFNRVDNSPSVSAALAVQAITSGVSRCVTVGLVGGLDTHPGQAWQQTQGPRQEAGFNAVARMIDDLAERPYDHSSWLDHTIIVGFSEFSRTPLLNLNGGRDHHITNSCFLAGGSVMRPNHRCFLGCWHGGHHGRHGERSGLSRRHDPQTGARTQDSFR